MAETIEVISPPVLDDDGYLVAGSGDTQQIHDCVVQPTGQSVIETSDVFDGDVSTLTVYAPSDARGLVEQGHTVIWRGLAYQVKYLPFDWAHGRRPALKRHRPKCVFVIERKET